MGENKISDDYWSERSSKTSVEINSSSDAVSNLVSVLGYSLKPDWKSSN